MPREVARSKKARDFGSKGNKSKWDRKGHSKELRTCEQPMGPGGEEASRGVKEQSRRREIYLAWVNHGTRGRVRKCGEKAITLSSNPKQRKNCFIATSTDSGRGSG